MKLPREAGTSLIEVLITISILSFGVLGIADMQVTAISGMHLAHQYSQAALLAQNIAEDLRANKGASMAGLYQVSPDSPPPAPEKNCSAAICTPTELAQWNISQWLSMLSERNTETGKDESEVRSIGLASGKLSINCPNSCTNHAIQTITIYWDSRRNGASGTGCNPSSLSDLSCFQLAYAL